jgi:hypothetical protein
MPSSKKRSRRQEEQNIPSAMASLAVLSPSSATLLDSKEPTLITPTKTNETTDHNCTTTTTKKRIMFGKYVTAPAKVPPLVDRMYRDNHRHVGRLGDSGLDDPMNGEFTQGSMQRLIEQMQDSMKLHLDDESIYFADIGSGSGKVVLHVAACRPNVALAMGIEVSKIRFIVSLLCQKDALERHDEYSRRVLFKYADVLAMDNFGPLTHIYAASAAYVYQDLEM